MSLLQVERLNAFYGDFQALFDVSLDVAPGTISAVIGPNGAGKTTLLRAIAGGVRKLDGAITLKSEPLRGLAPEAITRKGIGLVPEGRRLFPSLTVRENLLIGGSPKRSGPWDLNAVHDLFPILKERGHHMSTELSGGQQQMVAIGRALMTNPDLILCDEISLGLAPTIVEDIYALLPKITDNGTALIIVEQDVGRALRSATRVSCLMEGRVVLQGPADAYSFDEVAAAYFGAPAA